jgi:hypothetical protein
MALQVTHNTPGGGGVMASKVQTHMSRQVVQQLVRPCTCTHVGVRIWREGGAS